MRREERIKIRNAFGAVARTVFRFWCRPLVCTATQTPTFLRFEAHSLIGSRDEPRNEGKVWIHGNPTDFQQFVRIN